MTSTITAAAIAVLVLCGIVSIAVIAVITIWWRRGSSNLTTNATASPVEPSATEGRGLVMQPPPGRYTAPIDVSCESGATAFEAIFVRVSCGALREAGFTRFDEPISLVSPGAYTFSVFGVTPDGDETAIETYHYDVEAVGGESGVILRPPPGTYSVPLTIDASEAFRASSYVAVSPTYPVADQRMCFCLTESGVHVVLCAGAHLQESDRDPMRYVYKLRPMPPVIVPSGEGSEITDSTLIYVYPFNTKIDLQASLRYSVDGSEPSIPYVGPFHPPGVGVTSARLSITVRAVAIGRDGMCSDETRATFAVVSSGCAVFDPAVPEPTCVVTAGDPHITFEHPALQSGVPIAIFYAMGTNGPQQQWRIGERIKLFGSTIVELRAWAVHAVSGIKSAEARYVGTRNDGYASSLALKAQTMKSQRKKKKKTDAGVSVVADPVVASNALEPPSIICGCHSVMLRFDPPPVDTYTLRYTLNGAEPDESSPRYVEGSSVDITAEVAMNGGQVYIIARYFCRDDPRPGQPPHVAPITRYGYSFSRVFSIM